MGYKNREVEVKMLAVGVKGLQTMVDRIDPLFKNASDIIIGNAADLYWSTPKNSPADFVRLRRVSNASDEGQITAKATDKGSTVDRVEIDLPVPYKQAKALMLAAHGDPTAEVVKKYHVYLLENDDTTVSVYQVRNDDRVFVEVEARTKKRVAEIIRVILAGSNTDYEWIQSSVYNMFVEKKAMKSVAIQKFLESV